MWFCATRACRPRDRRSPLGLGWRLPPNKPRFPGFRVIFRPGSPGGASWATVNMGMEGCRTANPWDFLSKPLFKITAKASARNEPIACDFEEILRPTPGEPQSTQVLDGAVEEDGVPADDRGGDEAQAGSPEALILEDPVTDFALAVGIGPRCTICWSTLRRRHGRRLEARPLVPLAKGRAAHQPAHHVTDCRPASDGQP